MREELPRRSKELGGRTNLISALTYVVEVTL